PAQRWGSCSCLVWGLGALTIDQSPLCAPEASGMLSGAAGCRTFSGAGCWLPNPGFPSGLAPLAVPGRSGIPANPGNPAVGLLLEGSPCLLRENWAPGGSGTPGGRRLALLPNVLGTPKAFASGDFAGSGGTLVLARVVSTGGIAPRLSIARSAPTEQRVKASK